MDGYNKDCSKCELFSGKLHKDLPFGCFGCQLGLEGCMGESNDTSYREKWIKNHPSWKGIPHLVLWYYMKTEEDYLEFLKHYPDVEHAPNESWKSMYDTLILK